MHKLFPYTDDFLAGTIVSDLNSLLFDNFDPDMTVNNVEACTETGEQNLVFFQLTLSDGESE